MIPLLQDSWAEIYILDTKTISSLKIIELNNNTLLTTLHTETSTSVDLSSIYHIDNHQPPQHPGLYHA